MIGLGLSRWYFFYCQPADTRTGFDGLSALVRTGMKRDPLSGDVFVFFNRRRILVKGFNIGSERLCALLQATWGGYVRAAKSEDANLGTDGNVVGGSVSEVGKKSAPECGGGPKIGVIGPVQWGKI